MDNVLTYDELMEHVSMEHKLWFNHNWLFHVSAENKKVLHLDPKTYSREGEDKIKHICFAPTITKCLLGLPKKDGLGAFPTGNKNLYVYGLDLSKWSSKERSEYIRRPSRDLYLSTAFVQEMWVLKSVDIPQIMIIAPTANDSAIKEQQYYVGRDMTLVKREYEENKKFHTVCKIDANKRQKYILDYSRSKRLPFNSLPSVHFHKWRIVKVTADPSLIGKNLYDKLEYMRIHAPWDSKVMKTRRQNAAAKESLLLDYEEMEDFFDLSERFAEYGQELLDIYDNINTLNLCLQKETSLEGVSFINSLISTEADATAGTTGADPSGKKPNVAGQASKTVNTSPLNAGTIMDKMKEFARRVGRWIIEFFTKSTVYAQKLMTNLGKVMLNIRNNKTNLSFKLNNVAVGIADATLDPWLSKIDGVSDRNQLGTVFQQMKDTLESKVIKESKVFQKSEIDSLLQSYSEANNRVIKAKASAMSKLKEMVTKAKGSTDPKEVKAIQANSTALVNFVNYFVKFTFRNTMRVLSLVTKSAFSKNEQGNDNTSQNNPDNTKDTTGTSVDESIGL